MSDPAGSLDLDNLMAYYKSFSVSGVTFHFTGRMVPSPSGALRESDVFRPHDIDFDPVVLPCGAAIKLHLGHGANFGSEHADNYQSMTVSPTDRFARYVSTRTYVFFVRTYVRT
ncbi:hypothetical protein FOA52_013295 [Chlamydomonas sp. UWO 241]|nr:hypothetical protein FOA52_013295 [Chlamydomonas sp. UWO 241]